MGFQHTLPIPLMKIPRNLLGETSSVEGQLTEQLTKLTVNGITKRETGL
jgi:hypothetical protein